MSLPLFLHPKEGTSERCCPFAPKYLDKALRPMFLAAVDCRIAAAE
jgi:hypothetical protein